MKQVRFQMPFLRALSLRGSTMSPVSNVIEFEAKKDEDLQLEVLLLLKYIKQVSVRCTDCSLKRTQVTNGWIIELVWYDANAMHDHLSSKPLEILANLLIAKCSRVSFGALVSAAA